MLNHECYYLTFQNRIFKRIIRNHSMDIKQATSLSLRNLNQESNKLSNSGSYLKTYLLDRQKSITCSGTKKKKKKLNEQQRHMSCDDLGIFEVDTVMGGDGDDDEDESENEQMNGDGGGEELTTRRFGKLNKMNFFPHTAPAAAGTFMTTAESSDNLSMFPIIRNNNFNSNSKSNENVILSASMLGKPAQSLKKKEKTDDRIKSLRV